MAWTLSGVAKVLGLQLRGDDCEINGLNTLEDAGPDEISFLANVKYASYLGNTRAGAVIVDEEHADQVRRALVSKNPYQDFGRALALFARPQGSYTGISERAFIHPEASVAASCTVYPFVYVGAGAIIGERTVLFPGVYVGENSRIGERCALYPNAVLMADTVLGDGCIVHACAVLGADGFGFARTEHGIQKIPQIGSVAFGDDVEIGAGSAVDRAVLGVTRIGEGTKIDNLVQVGHNVSVGKECFLVSQVGISGSTRVGDRVTMAGQVGVAGHLRIGNDVTIGPKSGVAKDIPDGQTCGGTPCVDGRTFLRTITVMPKLPDMYKRLAALEKELNALQDLLPKERK